MTKYSFYITTLFCIAWFVTQPALGYSFNTFANKRHITINNETAFNKQVIYPNTIYEVATNVDLIGDFTMPKESSLFFRGGVISGRGKLIGDETQIIAEAVLLFNENITLKGSWIVNNAYCEWFGASVTKDDNTIPLQKCIDAFNMLNLNIGTYKTTKTLEIMKDGCLISGVTRDKSKIEKTSLNGEYINAVINIKNINEHNIQHVTIKDMCLSSVSYNVDYGIYTMGVNSSEFRNLTIFQCKNGFYCLNEKNGSLWNLIFDNVECNSNTIREFDGIKNYGYPAQSSCGFTCVANGGASLHFNHCWARDCAIGYHLKGVNYSIMNGCGADNIHNVAYLLEYCGLTMTSCGMENVITNNAIVLYYCNATLTGFDDYKLLVKNNKETYRVKIDGGNVTLINCHFSEWVNNKKSTSVFGVTSNNGSKVLLINTKQLNHINSYMALTKGATFRIIE